MVIDKKVYTEIRTCTPRINHECARCASGMHIPAPPTALGDRRCRNRAPGGKPPYRIQAQRS